VKTNEHEPIMPVVTSGPRDKCMKRSTLGSWGQIMRSRSHETKDIF